MAITNDLAGALQTLRPGAEWVLNGNALTWLDKVQTQPSDAEIQATITQLSQTKSTQNTKLSNAKSLLRTAALTDPKFDALLTVLGL